MEGGDAMNVQPERLAGEPQEVVDAAGIVGDLLEDLDPCPVGQVLPEEAQCAQPELQPGAGMGTEQVQQQVAGAEGAHTVAELLLGRRGAGARPGLLEALHVGEQRLRSVAHGTASTSATPRGDTMLWSRRNSRARSRLRTAGW
jgi:hypothetical protein